MKNIGEKIKPKIPKGKKKNKKAGKTGNPKKEKNKKVLKLHFPKNSTETKKGKNPKKKK